MGITSREPEPASWVLIPRFPPGLINRRRQPAQHPGSHGRRGGLGPGVGRQFGRHGELGQGGCAAGKGLELQAGSSQQPPTCEFSSRTHPGEAECRAGIGNQRPTATALTGLPARQGTIEAQPGWGRDQGHVAKPHAPLGIQAQLGRQPPHSCPGLRLKLQRLQLQRRRRTPAEHTIWPRFSPVPAAVADQQPTGRPRLRSAQIPSPIRPGRWIPHSCFRPPKRVERPLIFPESGALECQSPTVE